MIRQRRSLSKPKPSLVSSPPAWQSLLVRALAGRQRLAILGIGNPQKGDDGVGGYCAGLLARQECGKDNPALRILLTGESPENFTSEIRRFQPSHVLIIDAVAAGRAPGTILPFTVDRIPTEELTTHRLPLSLLVRFIERTMGSRVVLVGIEPGSLEASVRLSSPVRRSARDLAAFLARIVAVKG